MVPERRGVPHLGTGRRNGTGMPSSCESGWRQGHADRHRPGDDRSGGARTTGPGNGRGRHRGRAPPSESQPASATVSGRSDALHPRVGADRRRRSSGTAGVFSGGGRRTVRIVVTAGAPGPGQACAAGRSARDRGRTRNSTQEGGGNQRETDGAPPEKPKKPTVVSRRFWKMNTSIITSASIPGMSPSHRCRDRRPGSAALGGEARASPAELGWEEARCAEVPGWVPTGTADLPPPAEGLRAELASIPTLRASEVNEPFPGRRSELSSCAVPAPRAA